MAKNDNIIDFTTDIADAIREKTGETGLINPQDFSTVIRGISGAENLDAELNEQETLLAKLEEDVNALSDKPTDMLQARVDSVNSCENLFYDYDGENLDFAKNLDTSKATSFSNVCYSCAKLTSVPLFDTRNATSFRYAFFVCNSLKEIPPFDTSNVEDFLYAFSGCKTIKTVPLLNTSKGTTFMEMFSDCAELLEVPQLDFSNATTLSSLFDGCKKLKTIKPITINNTCTGASMFYSCYELESDIEFSGTGGFSALGNMFRECRKVKKINFSNLKTNEVKSTQFMFSSCGKLETVLGKIDMISVTNANSMFDYVYQLKDITLANIKVALNIKYGTNLTLNTILNIIKELWDLTGSTAKTLTLSTESKELIANVYVKLITITDEMRAEDEHIDNKLPFVVCESTDEGAITIQEYITSKNWNLA